MAYVLSDIVTRVQKRVRDTSYPSTDIKAFINDAQRAVFNEYDLRFMETTQNYTLAVNLQDITNGSGLPANFVSPISVQITTASYEKDLQYIDYKELDTLYPNQSDDDATQPRYWYMYGNTISVYPKPDLAYAIRLRYIKEPTTLSADADVPELPSEFEELLIYGAGFRVFEEKDMDDKAAVFEAKYDRQVQLLVIRYGFRKKGTMPILRLNRRPVRQHATSFFGQTD